MSKGQQSKYLNELLNKHSSAASKTGQFLQGKNQAYQNKIIDGKYQIRKASPAKSERDKSRDNSRTQIHTIVTMKKDLESKLQIIEENLSGLTKNNQTHNMTEQQRQKFIKKMEKQRKQAEKKRLQQIKDTEAKTLQLQKKHKEETDKQENEKKEKKKKQIEKALEDMKSFRQKRNNEIKSQNQMLSQKMKQKALYDKMMEQYRKSEVLSLQERKKKLAQIRSLHKPLSKEDFNDHLNKIESLKNQRNKSQADSLKGNKITQFYKSSWYQKVSHEPRKSMDEKASQQLEQLKQMRQKSVRYAQHVRDNHKPAIDQIKQKEFKAKLQKQASSHSLKQQQARQLGLKYLKMSKQMIDRQAKQKTSENDNSRHKPINYLEQLKQNKKQSKVSSAHDFVESIKRKEGLSKTQKAKRIMQYAQKLENKARMKEQLDKINKNLVDEDLDQLYMEAIEAKLSLLQKK